MDAVKFLQEKNRMCNTYELCHQGCPLWSSDDTCLSVSKNNPEVFVEAVKKWSEENPPKTLLDLFKEQHPNAPLDEDGTPKVCPHQLGYTSDEEDDSMCKPNNCVPCWNRPAKEN